jgi:hypothetical protein
MRGRPAHIAIISLEDRHAIELRQSLTSVCRALKYSEITALGRALDRHPSTIRKWAAGRQFPGVTTAEAVLAWAAKGRPVTKLEDKVTMF